MRTPRLAWWCREARRLGLTQIDEEARALLRIVSDRRPRRVLEIGTAHGGSFLLWARAARPDATLVSVDPRYYRPTEVDLLVGDASKARDRLGWRSTTPFPDLVAEMMAAELEQMPREHMMRRFIVPE